MSFLVAVAIDPVKVLPQRTAGVHFSAMRHGNWRLGNSSLHKKYRRISGEIFATSSLSRRSVTNNHEAVNGSDDPRENSHTSTLLNPLERVKWKGCHILSGAAMPRTISPARSVSAYTATSPAR